MGLLPDMQNCGLRMSRECRERVFHHRLQSRLVSDPSMHHGTCVTHVPWCMSGSPPAVAGKTFPAFPAHAQPAVIRIWKEAHYVTLLSWWGESTGDWWNPLTNVRDLSFSFCNVLLFTWTSYSTDSQVVSDLRTYLILFRAHATLWFFVGWNIFGIISTGVYKSINLNQPIHDINCLILINPKCLPDLFCCES